MTIELLLHRLAILGAALLCTATSALAATITVTNTANAGPGSLRAALASAANGDTIDATGVSGTILLTTGELFVTNSVAIVGPGPGSLAINGNATSRVLSVSSNLVVSISGLTITNGVAFGSFDGSGGGIHNDHSTLTMSNCIVSGNLGEHGGGIFNHGYFGSATLTIVGTTCSSNRASASGGGIYNWTYGGNGSVSVIASTIIGNSAFSVCGGIFNAGFTGNATLVVIASTISGNSSDHVGGLFKVGSFGNASCLVSSSTFSNNTSDNLSGANLFNYGYEGTARLIIGNTILSPGASGSNVVNELATFISSGYNLSSDYAGGLLTNTTDQINTDPKLGPLQNNGGPTFTHALLAGSPAIDKGKRDTITNLVSTTDQRGFPRPADAPGTANAIGGDGSDIGAFEMQLTATPILLTSPQKLFNGPFQLSFTNTPGASFTIMSSTNVSAPLTNWMVLGPPTEISPGSFQYADPQATNWPQGFYGVRSP